MFGLQLAGQPLGLGSARDGTDPHPEAHAPGAILLDDVDGEATRAQLAGELRRSAPVAESPDLDLETRRLRWRGARGRAIA